MKTIPVIGNGDVTTPQAAKMMFDETGCAGVSIGRGAFYNPWIFRRTLHYLKRGRRTRLSLTQRTMEQARRLSYAGPHSPILRSTSGCA